jgi:hypothetical protein
VYLEKKNKTKLPESQKKKKRVKKSTQNNFEDIDNLIPGKK